MTSSNSVQIDTLLQAIKTLEAQRDVLGDDVVQASIAAIQKQLAELEDSKQEVAQQRKLATILFTDIVGHTKLIQDLDPEVNMEIIDGALLRLAEIVEAHGGHIARFQGDGFKAIFGAPTAHESDPERAICAGLGIIAAAQIVDRELEAKWNLRGFRVRVGIDTGLVVVGGETEAEDTIKGVVVNLAARLESAAPPGGLLISSHTYQHVQGLFDVEPQEPILAKGFPDPVPVYLVKKEKPRAFHLGTRGVEGVETKMVGRDSELKQMGSAYLTAVSQRQTTVVTLVGEAGVGKSRLLFEFEKWLGLRPESTHIFNGRAAQQTQGTSNYLLRDILAARFQILDSDAIDIVRQKFVAGLIDCLPDKGEMKAHILGTWLGYDFGDSPHLQQVEDDPQQIKNRASLYLAQFFATISAKFPTVILLEDIHWSDRASLDNVIDLARQQRQMPLLIICLARPSLYERRPAWGEKIPTHVRLDLAPLSIADTGTLVAEILHRVEPLPRALLELVSSRAEGNPFYAEELVKMLIDEGTIVTGAKAWHVLLEQLLELNVPSTLAGVLQARLDRLAANEKLAVQQASVIGRIFWDSALAALPEDGYLALPALQAKEFIYPRAESAFAGTDEYIFKHALLRDVTYETVLLRLRRDYHARIARWIEQNAADRLNEFCALIAEHFTLAEEYDLASSYWEQAGEAAITTGNAVSAQEAFELALELLPEGAPLQVAELERKLAISLDLQLRPKEAEIIYRAALARLEELPSTAVTTEWKSLKLNLLLELSGTLYSQLRPDAMAELSEQIEALMDEVGTAKWRTSYYSRLALMAFLQNRARLPLADLPLVHKAVAYAQESGSASRLAGQQFHLGFHLLWLHRLEEAEPLLQKALATHEELGNLWSQNRCLTYLSVLHRFQGRISQVASGLSLQSETSRKLGETTYAGVSQANKAWLHYRAEEWRQAQAEAEAALAAWAKGVYPLQWLAHWPLLAIALQKKRLLDALAAARAMLDPKQQQLPDQMEEVLDAAVAAWEDNDKAAARSYLVTAVEIATQHGYL